MKVQASKDSQSSLGVEPEAEDPNPHDSRTPLQRFKARRPLSVTNIVSPAWCEIQYWYSLTKYGRVRRTKAMKQGTSVHKVMEEQTTTKLPIATVQALVKKVLEEELKKTVTEEAVASVVAKVLEKEKRTEVPVDVAAGLVHKVLEKEKIAPVAVDVVSESVHKAMGEKMRVAVSVETVTREDAFGLRIWNVIQSLRNLRATGSSREIETWAVIEGEVVNGVIDEISYECPDDDLEASITEQKNSKQAGKRKRQPSLLQGQSALEELWSNAPEGDSWLGLPHESRKVYLADIKTRGTTKLPNEVAFRPTSMQLMMYHRMLSLLATNSVPAEVVFTRYALDSSAMFSDSFVAQIGNLELDLAAERVEDPSVAFENEQDAMDEILEHNTLAKLWTLMMKEFSRAMPSRKSEDATSPIGDVLRVEYRASGNGSVVGVKTFAYDAGILDAYIKHVMAWWKGERMPKGVDIEEAYKCGMCEFADRCTWRREKVDQSLKQASKSRLRKQVSSASQV